MMRNQSGTKSPGEALLDRALHTTRGPIHPDFPQVGNEGELRAAAERMVRTFRDWMAGCDNGTRWKEVEAAHINLRDALTVAGARA